MDSGSGTISSTTQRPNDPTTQRSNGLLYTSACFDVLETALLTALRAVKESDPLAPVWVMVPTNRLQQHLARRLAESGPGHFNVRFLTLLDFAREVAEADLWARGSSPLPALGDLELARALAPETLQTFGSLAGTPRFLEAVTATVTDLVDAGVDLERLIEIVAPGASRRRSGGAGTGRASKIAAVASFAARYRAALRRLRFHDGAGVLAAAAEKLERGEALPVADLFVYGFYDLTPLQRRLVGAALVNRRALVFFPWAPQRSFEYATQTRSWFVSLGLQPQSLPDVAGDSDLARAQRAVFEEEPGEAQRRAPDGTLQVISAPGEVREAREVARAVLRLVRDREMAFADIGILLRQREPHARLLAETFARVGIPFFLEGGTPLIETRAGQALVLLLKVLHENFARPAVMELVASAPLLAVDRVAPSVWERLSIEAGIVAGEDEWRTRLARLRGRYPDVSAPGAAEDGGRSERDRRRLEDFIRFAGELLSHLSAVPQSGTWRELCDSTLRAFRRFVVRDEESDDVAKAVAELARLDAAGQGVDRSRFGDAVRTALETASKSRGSFGSGVFVGEILQSRGQSFRAVIIPGLVEKQIPRLLSQDPILLDRDRQRINELLSVELPLKQDRPEEERLLFSLMLRAGRECAVLTFPRLDVATARDRVPSWYLLEILSAVDGLRPTFGDLDGWKRLERVSLSRLAPSRPEDALDREESDLYAVEEVLREGDVSAAMHLFEDAPLLYQSAWAHEQRWGSDRLTPFDGRLDSEECRRLLKEKFSPATIAVAGTSLQQYARCPYGYFLRHILGLRETEAPEDIDELTARDRGNLIHAVLQDFFTTAAARGLLPLSSAGRDSATALLDDVIASRLDAFQTQGSTGSDLLWRRSQRHLREDLQGVLQAEMEDRGAYRPRDFEYRFGDTKSGDAPVAIDLPDRRRVALWGRIDRVDVDANRRGRVIDYKTGKYLPRFEKGLPVGDVLQLLVYKSAMCSLEPGVDWAEAQLYGIGRGKPVRHATLPPDAETRGMSLPQMLLAITEGIEKGIFPAVGKPWCGYCQFASVCGSSRDLFPAKRDDPVLETLRVLHEHDPE